MSPPPPRKRTIRHARRENRTRTNRSRIPKVLRPVEDNRRSIRAHFKKVLERRFDAGKCAAVRCFNVFLNNDLYAEINAAQADARKHGACDQAGGAEQREGCGEQPEGADAECEGEDLEVDEPDSCADGADGFHDARGDEGGA